MCRYHSRIAFPEAIDKLIKKKTEASEEESLVREIVPMVTVDPIEVPLPIQAKPQPSEPESEIQVRVNTYFSSRINEPAFKTFINVNTNKFCSCEDKAILYLLMVELSLLGTSKKDFHNLFQVSSIA